MDKCGYDFVIMVKGMNSFVSDFILENKDKFENSRECNIRQYKTYGMTVKKQLYTSDTKERYFHLFYSDHKAATEREQIDARMERMMRCLNSLKGQKVTIGEGYKEYFHLETYEEDGTFLFARERADVIERERSLGGYFAIVTSEKMTAKEALELYKSRDTSEKLFKGDKSYLGNKSLRVQSDEAASAKIFVEFVALIVRCKMYTMLKDEVFKMERSPNCMTVPAVIRELEKIEIVRGLDGRYRMDHAVTATQKDILRAFHMDAGNVKKQADELSEMLVKYEKQTLDITYEDIYKTQDNLWNFLFFTGYLKKTAESYYYGFLSGLLKGCSGYITISNRESGNGNTVMKTPSVRGMAIIIEIKIAKDIEKWKKAVMQY